MKKLILFSLILLLSFVFIFNAIKTDNSIRKENENIIFKQLVKRQTNSDESQSEDNTKQFGPYKEIQNDIGPKNKDSNEKNNKQPTANDNGSRNKKQNLSRKKNNLKRIVKKLKQKTLKNRNRLSNDKREKIQDSNKRPLIQNINYRPEIQSDKRPLMIRDKQSNVFSCKRSKRMDGSRCNQPVKDIVNYSRLDKQLAHNTEKLQQVKSVVESINNVKKESEDKYYNIIEQTDPNKNRNMYKLHKLTGNLKGFIAADLPGQQRGNERILIKDHGRGNHLEVMGLVDYHDGNDFKESEMKAKAATAENTLRNVASKKSLDLFKKSGNSNDLKVLNQRNNGAFLNAKRDLDLSRNIKTKVTNREYLEVKNADKQTVYVKLIK